MATADQKHDLLKMYYDIPEAVTSFTRISNPLIANQYRIREYKPAPGTAPGSFKPKGLTPAELVFIIHILRFKRDNPRVPLSNAYVSRAMGMSSSSVRRMVRRLVDDKLITKTYDAKKHKFSRYSIKPLLERLAEIDAWDKEEKATAKASESADLAEDVEEVEQ